MNLEEALNRIKALESEAAANKKALASKDRALLSKDRELAKKDALIFELGRKLNEALRGREAEAEKKNIEHIRQFVPRDERFSVIINETEEALKEKAAPGRRGRKKGGRNFPSLKADRYVTKVVYEDPEETVCPDCGARLVPFSQRERIAVEYVPSSLTVTKTITRSFKCPECSGKSGRIFYPLSKAAFPGSILTPSFAAYVAYCKYELGIPFHHLSEHIENTLGIAVSKQDLAGFMKRTSDLLEPVYDRMKADLLANHARVIHSDETTLTVSHKGKDAESRRKSYVYVYSSSYYDDQIQIYDFHESRSIDETASWLKGYSGCIVCDGFSGYRRLASENERISLQMCWAHVRRRFSDIVKAMRSEARPDCFSARMLREIGRLFALEKGYREQKLDPAEISKRRERDQKGILGSIEEMLTRADPVPGSALEGAVGYMRGCWPYLKTYLSDGHIEMTNNIAERAVKPFVVARKVFQTSGSYAGARYTGKLFSIMRTAKINGLDVRKYFEYAISHVKTDPTESLLPYRLDRSLFRDPPDSANGVSRLTDEKSEASD